MLHFYVSNTSLVHSDSENLSEDAAEYVNWMNSYEPNGKKYYEPLSENNQMLLPYSKQPPKVEQKPLPCHLRYAYFWKACTLLVIVLASLVAPEEDKLLRGLRDHKNAIAWSLADLKGIHPSMCIIEFF